jgi:hypothetical protein
MRLPLSFFFLLFHLLVAMRLDGEEQGRAYDEELERDKDDRNPIHDFLDTLRRQPDNVSSRTDVACDAMTILLLVAVTVPKRSLRLQTQICQKTADQMNGMGAFPGSFL